MTKRQSPIELLAPGGDIDSIKAAIIAGADAVYCGLDRFNARNRAENITYDNLLGIIELAHSYNCQIFLTLNIIILDSEFNSLINLLNRLVNSGIDALIIQDFGLAYVLANYFPTIIVHSSTQLTTHNRGQILFLKALKSCRVNLSRELSIHEIKSLSKVAVDCDIETEVFVHGSNCISFSGICYMSSFASGKSGNRGRCSQPCRDEYNITEQGNRYPLNIKDKSAVDSIKELIDADITSIKIEGRIKKYHYVYTVVKSFREAINRIDTPLPPHIKENLSLVFNRELSSGYIDNSVGKDMFIDYPRDGAALYLAKNSNQNLDSAKKEIFNRRTDIINTVKKQISTLSIGKQELIFRVTGEEDSPLTIDISSKIFSFIIKSRHNLSKSESSNITEDIIYGKLKSIDNYNFFIGHIDTSELRKSISIPFKDFANLKRDLIFNLNSCKKPISPIELPKIIGNNKNSNKESRLSVILSSLSDIANLQSDNYELFYKLPSSISNYKKIISALKDQQVTPWFPSLIIGKDYDKAVQFLEELMPKQIVTDNTGIAYEAFRLGIDWIAGDALNIANSYALISLKENFNCSGVFISNELNSKQIRPISPPPHFRLFYTIYSPITLMTTRQCLFQPIEGCEKSIIDMHCIEKCSRKSAITNLKNEKFIINKTNGNYNQVLANTNKLNLEIIKEYSNKFDSFSVDLSDITTDSNSNSTKRELITMFSDFLNGNIFDDDIYRAIGATNNKQYLKGI